MMSLPECVFSEICCSVRRLSPDRAGHAVTAAAAAAELGATDRDYLDPLLPEEGIGGDIAVVGNDHARLERHDVVAVIPLLPFGLVVVAARANDSQLVQPESVADHLQKRLRVLAHLERAAVVSRTGAVAFDLIDD